jgi:hypothetical protein
MANRRATIDKDHLYCPVCFKDYSKTNLVQRFDKIGNTHCLRFICDCKRRLSLRALSNGWFKIYDVTEEQIRRNAIDREKRKLKRDATNNQRTSSK